MYQFICSGLCFKQHIAFGSIRMEPVFMILGQSAAVQPCMAIDKNIAVQDVNYESLKNKLIEKGTSINT